jgi:hypothetical protein
MRKIIARSENLRRLQSVDYSKRGMSRHADSVAQVPKENQIALIAASCEFAQN